MNKRLTREACIKIIEQAERTEAEFADCFTAAVTGDSMHDIYKVRIVYRQKSTTETIKLPKKHMLQPKSLFQKLFGAFLGTSPSTENGPF